MYVWSSDLRGVDLDALVRRQEVLERAVEKLRTRLVGMNMSYWG